jgi:hypothetical protein
MNGNPSSKRRNDRKKGCLVKVILSQDLWRLIRSSTKRRLQLTPRKRESSVSIVERRVTIHKTAIAKRRNALNNKYV